MRQGKGRCGKRELKARFCERRHEVTLYNIVIPLGALAIAVGLVLIVHFTDKERHGGHGE